MEVLSSKTSLASENNIGSQQNSSLKAKYDETRTQEEIDELNAKFRDLYEQYKNTTAFEKLNVLKQAMELVKAEAERKGYVVKVYHGTGADGFNVAKADSSEEQNGEGNQAHGAGLYMAVSRDTAEEYRDKGQTVAEFSAQMDMFREKPSDEVMFLCKLFEDNQRTSSGISGVLKEYASQVKKIDTATANLFGDEDPSKFDKLQSAYNHYATDIANQDTGANLKAKEVDGNSINLDSLNDNSIETLRNLSPEEIFNRLKLAVPTKFPVARLEEEYNLKYYWSWFEKNLLNKVIPTKIRRNAEFKEGHFLKLISGGRNKGFIKGYDDWRSVLKAIKKGKILLNNEETTPEGFSMSRARQMPLVLDVLQDPFFVLKDKKTKDYIFIKKYEDGKDWISVMFNADALGIISWHQKNISKAFVERNTLEYQKSEIDFQAQPRKSTKGYNNPKTPLASENNTGSQQNSSLKAKYDETRSQEEIDELNAKFRDLYEQYKNTTAFEKLNVLKQAMELVKAEAERKGYVVKVYHGTGADGFNVAKADSSEQQNGEGNQAHGAGLYMAVSRDTARGYRDRAYKKIIGYKIKEKSPKHWGINEDELLDENNENLLHSVSIRGFDVIIEECKNLLNEQKGTREDLINLIPSFTGQDRIALEELFVRSGHLISNNEKNLNLLKKVKDTFEKNGLKASDISFVKSKGHIFNWFTNLNEDNTLDEHLIFSEQSKGIQEKLKKAVYALTDKQLGGLSKDNILRVFNYTSGGSIYDRFVKFAGSKLKASEHLLKHGIKGLTYYGGQDGRCYVSFEGGATVKLQDPFTFDDNGELIPLSERFNEDNPDIRWKVDEQIETPQFKAWFGNSKVVDENGKPLHVYHGTNSRNVDYSVFDVFKGKYHFFSDDRDIAGSIGSYVYDVFLKIENPLIIDANGNIFSAIKDHSDGIVKFKDLTATQKKKLCKAFDFTTEELEKSYKPEDKIDLVQAGVIKRPERSSDEWAMFAKTNGYDGVIFKNLRDGAGFNEIQKTSDVYVVFDSIQIKDATGANNGDFSLENPSIKWKVDTVLMPIDINLLVAQNIDALMNAIRKSHKPILSKKAELEKKYSQDDKDRKSKIQNDLRLFILENFSSELVPIAKLSDKDFKFYRKQFGLRDRFVYTSFGYAIEHFFNRHPETPIENYLLLPDTIINPDKKKEVGRWVKDEWGQPLYEASEAFIKEYDKWHVSTIKVDTQLTSSGKKLVAFKNFYEDSKKSKEPYKNKKTIEDFWKNALSSSDSSRRYANISHAQKSQSSNIASSKKIESQGEKSTRLKALLRQERSENPVIWASIVLAKEILRGRAITGAKLEKVLPSGKFDGTQRQYAIDRAKLIAEQCKATQEDYINRLDQAVKLAENEAYN